MAERKACNYFGRGMRDPGRGNSKCMSPHLWSMCDQQRCLRDTQPSYISESDASTSAMADFPAWAMSKLSSPFKLIFRGLQQSPSGVLLFLPVCGLVRTLQLTVALLWILGVALPCVRGDRLGVFLRVRTQELRSVDTTHDCNFFSAGKWFHKTLTVWNIY